jgi:kynurenine formamidase
MSETKAIMRFEAEGRRFRADVARPLSIAIPLDFAGAQPSCFGAPRAESRPLQAGGFPGDTRAGGSCNCAVLTLTPHCNGTHTECVGHVTDERIAVSERVPGGLVLARLVSVAAVDASATAETSEPAPRPGDRLITAAALAESSARIGGPRASALVVRTADGSPHRAYSGPAPAPFLTREAAAWLVDGGVDTLVLDLPSADRADDGGHLTAHRIFFGLPPGSRRAADARRPCASITELAWIDAAIADGLYLLDLQLPAFVSDAAPSRPLLFALHPG